MSLAGAYFVARLLRTLAARSCIAKPQQVDALTKCFWERFGPTDALNHASPFASSSAFLRAEADTHDTAEPMKEAALTLQCP